MVASTSGDAATLSGLNVTFGMSACTDDSNIKWIIKECMCSTPRLCMQQGNEL